MGEPAVKIEEVDLRESIAMADVDPDVIPIPQLWSILIEPIKVEEATKAGIVMASETIDVKERLRYVGKVIAKGPGAYQHPKFDGIPDACEVGDWIVYRAFDGMDIKVLDRNGNPATFRLINDDEVKTTVPDPHVLLTPF